MRTEELKFTLKVTTEDLEKLNLFNILLVNQITLFQVFLQVVLTIAQRHLNSCRLGVQVWVIILGSWFENHTVTLFYFLCPLYHGSSSIMEGDDTRRIESLPVLIFNLQLIQPICEIFQLAIWEGFEVLRHGTGIIVVGIDARWALPWQLLKHYFINLGSTSTGFYECQAAFTCCGCVYFNAGLNPELWALFFNLRNYPDQLLRLFLYLMALNTLKLNMKKLSALIHIGLLHILYN